MKSLDNIIVELPIITKSIEDLTSKLMAEVSTATDIEVLLNDQHSNAELQTICNHFISLHTAVKNLDKISADVIATIIIDRYFKK